MSNQRLSGGLWQLLPRSWLNRKSSNYRRSGDKRLNKQLLVDLPFHEQIKNQMIYSLVATIEPHFEVIHDLLIWTNVDQSLTALFGINVIYWFIVFLSSHLLTAIAFFVFLYKVQEFWSTVVWPEIALEPPTPPEEDQNWTCVDPKLLSAPEITKFFDTCIDWIKNRLIDHWNLRTNNHLAFFLINLLVFTSLFYLGTILSGSVIVYFILMTTLLAPGINAHLFPFIRLSTKEEDTNSEDKSKKASKEDLSKPDQPEQSINQEVEMDKKELNEDLNLDKASKLFGQLLENTKSYLNQMFDAEPTEEFIKQKETELNKAHSFLTDVVLNQDPTFHVDNNELNRSFRFLEDEFKKLDKLKSTVKSTQPNSIESNLVTSHFGNESPSSMSSDNEDDFEIIPNPPNQEF